MIWHFFKYIEREIYICFFPLYMATLKSCIHSFHFHTKLRPMSSFTHTFRQNGCTFCMSFYTLNHYKNIPMSICCSRYLTFDIDDHLYLRDVDVGDEWWGLLFITLLYPSIVCLSVNKIRIIKQEINIVCLRHHFVLPRKTAAVPALSLSRLAALPPSRETKKASPCGPASHWEEPCECFFFRLYLVSFLFVLLFSFLVSLVLVGVFTI